MGKFHWIISLKVGAGDTAYVKFDKIEKLWLGSVQNFKQGKFQFRV